MRYKPITLVAVEILDDLAIMRDLLASGAIAVPIERTFPLSDVADAIRHLEAGRAMGKVVVVPCGCAGVIRAVCLIFPLMTIRSESTVMSEKSK